MRCATTDGAIAVLDGAGLRKPVLASLLDAVQRHLARRVQDAYRVGAITFSNEYGLLGQTNTVKEIIDQWNAEFFTE